jgi:hypothetical protein
VGLLRATNTTDSERLVSQLLAMRRPVRINNLKLIEADPIVDALDLAVDSDRRLPSW